MTYPLLDRVIVPRSPPKIPRPPLARVLGPQTIIGADPPAPLPLQKEPLVVTHGDAIAYHGVISDLVSCLDDDARAHLVYRNPGKLDTEGKDLVAKATAIDGCTDFYANCPGPTEAPLPTTVAETAKRLEANTLRLHAAGAFADADFFRKRANDRGLKNDAAGNAQVNAEIAFYEDLRTLAADVNAAFTPISSSTVVGSGTWKTLQALDVRYQILRARYIALGFTPSCGLPTFTSNSFPWGTVGLTLGIGAAIVVAGAILLPRVLTPAPASRRAPPAKKAAA